MDNSESNIETISLHAPQRQPEHNRNTDNNVSTNMDAPQVLPAENTNEQAHDYNNIIENIDIDGNCVNKDANLNELRRSTRPRELPAKYSDYEMN